ncbi:MAG: hypothetical protein ACUVX9_09575 [Anaerolineae bacterium]
MADLRVELAEIGLPDFGVPGEEPGIQRHEYEARLTALWERARQRRLDALVVYGDREHVANLAFLTGFDPRFEEALLIVRGDHVPVLITGNECFSYAAVSPLALDVRLFQHFSLLGQPRDKSRPLADMLRDAGLAPGRRGRRSSLSWRERGWPRQAVVVPAKGGMSWTLVNARPRCRPFRGT